jgi:SOS-response transcriptional repressor LexA
MWTDAKSDEHSDLIRRRKKTPPDPTYPDLPPNTAMVLRHIKEFMAASGGCPPSVREIGAACGMKSTNAVACQLQRLIDKGYVTRLPGESRGIRLATSDPDEKINVTQIELSALPLAAMQQLARYPKKIDCAKDHARYVAAARRLQRWLVARAEQR